MGNKKIKYEKKSINVKNNFFTAQSKMSLNVKRHEKNFKKIKYESNETVAFCRLTTMVQNNQEYRLKYWATPSPIP